MSRRRYPGPLRVLVLPGKIDPSLWIAQGLELNFTAHGESVSEARDNFVHGLKMSWPRLGSENQTEYCKAAPWKWWDVFYRRKHKDVTSVFAPDSIPFDIIMYIEVVEEPAKEV